MTTLSLFLDLFKCPFQTEIMAFNKLGNMKRPHHGGDAKRED